MPSLVVIGPQIKEKQRAQYMVLKDPSLNRVKAAILLLLTKFSGAQKFHEFVRHTIV